MILFRGRKINKKLQVLVEKAVQLGLPDIDINYAKEFLEYNEPRLCFEHIATQLDENDIKIDGECFEIVKEVAALMLIPPHDIYYLYLTGLLPKAELNT